MNKQEQKGGVVHPNPCRPGQDQWQDGVRNPSGTVDPDKSISNNLLTLRPNNPPKNTVWMKKDC